MANYTFLPTYPPQCADSAFPTTKMLIRNPDVLGTALLKKV